LRKVKQTLAAGWGGVGTTADYSHFDQPAVWRSREAPMRSMSDVRVLRNGSDRLDIPAFLRSAASGALERHRENLPDRLRRLLALIDADASRLDPSSAFDLLKEAGLAREFDELFRAAHELGLDVQAVAAIVLGDFLRGPLGECLPREASELAGRLLAFADRARQGLVEMSRRCEVALRAMEQGDTPDLVRPDVLHSVGEGLHRMVAIRPLLEHLGNVSRECVVPAE